ncbi:PX domain-containing protein 1 isoform X1 [Canis lupus familiaris]|uniref:PX domain containing 1 n=2 Tax=Canis lupus familiaris TaxID=9615 RepID=A0A8I3P6J2_CANLF|nr:PX domain-containing protein 1 isoform X1 [Canis lupus familiaris]XP_038319027.1 PX domain-containing protein 1 isoform X1 [Canis lupus familiaris]XP_038439976.1 PX domain-containing protein 1 isoform X1 [Canis lupus familiaris]
MASAVFEGTSLVNMFVRGCWVNGVRRLIVGRRGDEEDFFEIRTEWSDRSVLYLHRSLADLGRLWQRLRDAFPEDRPELARAPLRQGLVAIKDAHDIETRLNEVEKLLKTIISMPCKYSRSEVVLTFFERSPLDQVLKNDNVHKIQPSFQSPVKISEIMRSNGFCLANTETIVIDHSIPNGKDQHLGVDPTEHLPVQRAHWLSCGLARGGHQGPDGCASGARPEDRCFSFIGRASGEGLPRWGRDRWGPPHPEGPAGPGSHSAVSQGSFPVGRGLRGHPAPRHVCRRLGCEEFCRGGRHAGPA